MAILDEKAPGWEHTVDLRLLNMNSCFDCVVGQVFPSYGRGLRLLGEDVRERPRVYGFALDWGLHHAATYGGLTNAWKRAIRTRRRGAS